MIFYYLVEKIEITYMYMYMYWFKHIISQIAWFYTLYMESKNGSNILSVKALILKTVMMILRHTCMQLQQVE